MFYANGSEGNMDLCRLCLETCGPLYSIVDSGLKTTLEKILQTSFHETEGAPQAVCMICRAYLRKCEKLMIMSLKAEQVLYGIAKKRLSPTCIESTLTISDRVCNMITTKTKIISFDDFNVPVKEECEFETFLGMEDESKSNIFQVSCNADDKQPAGDTRNKCFVEVFVSKCSNSEDMQRCTCTSCDTVFEEQLNIPEHITNCHKIELDNNKCLENVDSDQSTTRPSVCVTTSSSQSNKCDSFKRHTKTTSQDKTLGCNLYGIQINGTSNMKSHLTLQRVVSDRKLKGNNVESHMRTQTSVKPYKCYLCNKSFFYRKCLRIHIKNHKRNKLCRCSVCNKNFSDHNGLKVHMRTHTGEKPYVCHICNTRFNQIGSLKRHKMGHSGEKPYTCDICNKKFIDKVCLRIHMRTHTGEKPYCCNVCGRRFIQSSNLQKHMRGHTGEKPYKCDVCHKKFRGSNYIKVHMRTHIPEKCNQKKPIETSASIKAERLKVKTNIQDDCKTELREDGIKRIQTDVKPFKCTECNKRFSASSNLKRHWRIHTGEKPYNCDVCDKKFSDKSNLKYHKSRYHTGDTRFKCSACDIFFSDSNSLKTHMRTHSGYIALNTFRELKKDSKSLGDKEVGIGIAKQDESKPNTFQVKVEVLDTNREFTKEVKVSGPNCSSSAGTGQFACRFCPHMFKANNELQQHILNVHMNKRVEDISKTNDGKNTPRKYVTSHPPENQMHRCKVCEKCFTTSNSLKRHTRLHTGEKPYGCDLCGKKFSDKSNLRSHMMLHTKETPFKCEVCNRSFYQSSYLESHMRIHTKEKPHKCDLCDKKFYYIKHLEAHIKSHKDEKPHWCEVCHKIFNKSITLKIHMRIHTGEKPFKCNVCDKRFISNNTLKLHTRTHTGEKPYMCDLCDKRFNQMGALKRHLICHTGEKPCTCDVCGKRISDSSCLKIHMRTHTGVKPYICDVCGRRFIDRNNLKKHIRVHTGEKPYKCYVCEKKFSNSSCMKRHIRTHTGEKPYGCEMCDKRFIKGDHLKKHMRTVHDNTGEEKASQQ